MCIRDRNQTRPAKEIVVVDDASTDRTVEIARSFGDRVKVLVNEVNSGPGHSRNAGVAASTGDYLAFLDADDLSLIHISEPTRLLSTSYAAFCLKKTKKRNIISSYTPIRPDGNDPYND